jgi:hypothetical protein
MLKAVFTLDYEIHGNGQGCPHALMVETTARMLRQFDAHGARLTILADVAEILKFRQYAAECGRDDYHYEKIAEQLRGAIRGGHDVQLHIHASYFNAKHENGGWAQDWSEYDFAGLKLERLNEIVALGKDYLESLLRPVNPAYRCNVFRAANWSVSPSKNVVRVLAANGFIADTSVFKYGRRRGLVNFDYSNAHDNLVAWRASEDDLCRPDPEGRLFEFPIYSEKRRIGAFLTPMRLYRACVSRLHRFPKDGSGPSSPGKAGARRGLFQKIAWLFGKHAWKADFNQCSGRQLIRALERAEADRAGSPPAVVPFVLIGHSKLFTGFNERSLEPFLSFVARNPSRFGFGTFGEFNLRDFSPAAVDARKHSVAAPVVDGLAAAAPAR